MWAELCFASQESVGDDGKDTNHTDFSTKCFIFLCPVQNSIPQCKISEPLESLNQEKADFLLQPTVTLFYLRVFLLVGGWGPKLPPFLGAPKTNCGTFNQSGARHTHSSASRWIPAESFWRVVSFLPQTPSCQGPWMGPTASVGPHGP